MILRGRHHNLQEQPSCFRSPVLVDLHPVTGGCDGPCVGVRAMVFTEAPLLTALANDEGYSYVYERLINLWAAPGDLTIAVSSSGNSENIVRAARSARERGGKVVTFSGFKETNTLRGLGDLNFYLPADVYGFVEIGHAAILHAVTDAAMQRVRERSQNGVGA